jgi:hypothetical protein
VAQHPEVAPDEPKPTVVTSNAPTHGVVGEDSVTVNTPGDDGEVVGSPQPVVHVAQPVVQAVTQTDKYLLKMTRENLVYQTRGYEFTQDHPYALVNATDAQWILENEEGFRQAFPAELTEFYG